MSWLVVHVKCPVILICFCVVVILSQELPIYKNDDKQRDIYYRPITVLPCVDKVYEVLLGQQVSNFIDDRLSDAIIAYRAKNSCETTLIRLTETWRAELDS